ncbi:GNAT family N-acetyltransferase [Photobacterium sp. CAU 1568]|uniref:GNAT family N-acetyltransferase n=1 Tax=Photobacterium arenosum TaxID=2774143 RepID=A0ABR9BGX9_9GAMM|nr:GNAT family N-acetyltransferase [Photobacterium arenosum]
MDIIRCCQASDLAGVCELYAELRPHDPVLSEPQAMKCWQDLLNSPHTKIIVADIDGVLASTCQLGLVPTMTNGGQPFAIIEHVITSAQYRRQGLSQKVIEKALSLAWDMGCYKVMLLSGENRPEAHHLYEKVGFQSGIERGFVIKNPHIPTPD